MHNHNALEGLHLIDLPNGVARAREHKETAYLTYEVGSGATTDAAHNYIPNAYDSRPHKIVGNHPHCTSDVVKHLDVLVRGNETVLEKFTARKHTTDLSRHRVSEHYTDGPRPDSTGASDTEIPNEVRKVSPKTNFDTTTHGEGRIGGESISLELECGTKTNVLRILGTGTPLDDTCDVAKGYAPHTDESGPANGVLDRGEESK